MDLDQDGTVTPREVNDAFGNWYAKWAASPADGLSHRELCDGLNTLARRPNFGPPGGGPGHGGPRGGGIELDPLLNAGDASKPLLSKLLAVPSLRARYLSYVRDMADKWLDWSRLGPIATQYHALIAEEVKADTRKIDSFEAFQQSLAADGSQGAGHRGPGGAVSLKRFADLRRAYLLNYREGPSQSRLGPAAAGPANSERPSIRGD
jgi:hypothetical protein